MKLSKAERAWFEKREEIIHGSGLPTSTHDSLRRVTDYFLHRREDGDLVHPSKFDPEASWTKDQLKWWTSFIRSAVGTRIKQIEKVELSAEEYSTRARSRDMPHSYAFSLMALGFLSSDSLYNPVAIEQAHKKSLKWWTSRMGNDMDMHMCTYQTPKSGKANPQKKIVTMGHVWPISSYDVRGDDKWYIKAFHWTQCGPQYGIENYYFLKEKIIFPRRWSRKKGGGYVDVSDSDKQWRKLLHDTPRMKEMRKVYLRDCMKLRATMSKLRKHVYGKDKVRRRAYLWFYQEKLR